MVDLTTLRRDLAACARSCDRRGLQTGNGGNLSARVPGQDRMLIKGTDVAFTECDPESFVVCDFDGALISGDRPPSKECLLHGALYRRLDRVGAIVHCHSGWATGWASTSLALPFATHHSRLKLKGEVAVFDTESYAVPASFFPTILEHFDRHPDLMAFLLKGHGQVALGGTVREATHIAELVEETAQIAILGRLVRPQ